LVERYDPGKFGTVYSGSDLKETEVRRPETEEKVKETEVGRPETEEKC